MSLGLRKYILSDVKVGNGNQHPPPQRGEPSVQYVLKFLDRTSESDISGFSQVSVKVRTSSEKAEESA